MRITRGRRDCNQIVSTARYCHRIGVKDDKFLLTFTLYKAHLGSREPSEKGFHKQGDIGFISSTKTLLPPYAHNQHRLRNNKNDNQTKAKHNFREFHYPCQHFFSLASRATFRRGRNASNIQSGYSWQPAFVRSTPQLRKGTHKCFLLIN